MAPRLLNPLLGGLAVAVIALSVWLVGHEQRDGVTSSFRQSQAAQGLLTAMLDQETGLRGYFQTGRRDFLEPFDRGDREFARQLGQLRRLTPGADRATHRLIDRAEDLGLRWTASAREGIVAARLGGSRTPPVRVVLARKRLMDAFRLTDERIAERLARQRQQTLGRASTMSMLTVLTLALLFAAGGWLTVGRRSQQRLRREVADRARRDRRTIFAETLQFMDSEEETHGLVKRHLEQSLPGTEIVVLQRNNSSDRLEAVTELADDAPLATALVDAGPRNCLSVRLGRRHEADAEAELVACGLCGRTAAARTTCTPLLVQGEVIGAVLAQHTEPLPEIGLEVIDDTVTQAAPVIANMRNLAIAELRAATDSLTGLANRRAMQDTLRRMFAHAVRSKTSLAAIALDLDHFKQVNDRFGHDRGDDVLAATAQALRSSLRTSDFVGRLGGEEFIVLLPDTGLDGALVVAENLRRAVSRLEIPGVDVPVTASFGVAVSPEDALEPELLLRQADRALYVAKEAGRNRVEAAAAPATHTVAVAPETPAS